ncbi:hypothetical protein KC318_g14 [Hortaea werneckii]|nr:hypothetical protein KC355_g15 [Hortaea werneckii]KAI7676782.1 hypothetical protein KC318_g14 [Hortaea werneckii]
MGDSGVHMATVAMQVGYHMNTRERRELPVPYKRHDTASSGKSWVLPDIAWWKIRILADGRGGDSSSLLGRHRLHSISIKPVSLRSLRKP